MVMHRRLILALAAALLMLLMVGSVAFADGPTTAGTVPAEQVVTDVKPVCVDGYVINHRENPIDGSKMLPKDANGNPVYLMVTASWAINGAPNTVSATVDKKGYFKFANLPKDTPIVFSIDLPDGWFGIAPEMLTSGGTARTNPTKFKWNSDYADDYCYRIVFKIKRVVSIKVYKWEERLDGTVRPGEEWVVTATAVNDPWAVTQVVTTTTSAQTTAVAPIGQAVLDLTPGTWNIAETLKSGWVALTPPVVQRIIDQYDPVTNEVVFKNREPVCHPKIIVTKAGYGTNADWKDEYLGVLPGFKFTVSRADNAYPPITKVTSGDGRAVFDGLYPGVYKVTETVPAGWEVIGDNPVTVTLVDCETVDVPFTDKELINQLKITGKKTFQAWVKPYKNVPVGLDGWEITAELIGVGTKIATQTNVLGEYEFTYDALDAAGMAIPGASIKVCEEERDHWIAVTPKCVTIRFPYPVPLGYKGAVVNFTNVQDPPSASAATAAVASAQPVASGRLLRLSHSGAR